MIIDLGEKVHVIYRTLHSNSTRRHFLGEVTHAEGTICRLRGYVFVHDKKNSGYAKKPGIRSTVVDLAESGYIVNLIDPDVILSDVVYQYQREAGLVAVDKKGFSLSINEFGDEG